MVTAIMCKLFFQSGTIVLVQQHHYCSHNDIIECLVSYNGYTAMQHSLVGYIRRDVTNLNGSEGKDIMYLLYGFEINVTYTFHTQHLVENV